VSTVVSRAAGSMVMSVLVVFVMVITVRPPARRDDYL
jgi:hypothetical protein